MQLGPGTFSVLESPLSLAVLNNTLPHILILLGYAQLGHRGS